MVDAPLIITADVIARLHRLRDFAAKRPVDMPPILEAMKTDDGRRRHMKQMNAQTVRIDGPWPFFVTFSIETNHPDGTMRHMSMSIMRDGRVPHPDAVWMVAGELGFAGGLSACNVWPEQLSDGATAINLVQPIAVRGEPGHA